MIQLITPNPNIPCRPGYCLEYVRKTYGLPARYPTATAAWLGSTSKHQDRNFPAGMWTPLWFGLENEPAGHVALLAPNGNVYSTSDLGSVPHCHLDVSDLMNYYARYDMTLTYRGWTEDVAGYPVMTGDGIAAMGTTNNEEYEVISDADIQRIADKLIPVITTLNDQYHGVTRSNVIGEISKKIEDGDYQVKVFTQNVVNPRADAIDAKLEEATRVRAAEEAK